MRVSLSNLVSVTDTHAKISILCILYLPEKKALTLTDMSDTATLYAKLSATVTSGREKLEQIMRIGQFVDEIHQLSEVDETFDFMATIDTIKKYLQARKEVKDTIPFKLLSLLGANTPLVEDVSDPEVYFLEHKYTPILILGDYTDKEAELLAIFPEGDCHVHDDNVELYFRNSPAELDILLPKCRNVLNMSIVQFKQ